MEEKVKSFYSSEVLNLKHIRGISVGLLSFSPLKGWGSLPQSVLWAMILPDFDLNKAETFFLYLCILRIIKITTNLPFLLQMKVKGGQSQTQLN